MFTEYELQIKIPIWYNIDFDDYLMTNIYSLNGGYTYSAIPHMIYHIKRQVNPVSKCLFNLLI